MSTPLLPYQSPPPQSHPDVPSSPSSRPSSPHPPSLLPAGGRYSLVDPVSPLSLGQVMARPSPPLSSAIPTLSYNPHRSSVTPSVEEKLPLAKRGAALAGESLPARHASKLRSEGNSLPREEFEWDESPRKPLRSVGYRLGKGVLVIVLLVAVVLGLAFGIKAASKSVEDGSASSTTTASDFATSSASLSSAAAASTVTTTGGTSATSATSAVSTGSASTSGSTSAPASTSANKSTSASVSSTSSSA